MKTKKPVVEGRASICTWTLQFHFFTQEQRDKAVKMIMKDHPHVNLSIWTDHLESKETYFCTINSHSWANNLTNIAKILEKFDYQME